jgi:hypothetical protein
MREQLWWYVARSSGIVAWSILTLAMTWGLLLRTKLLAGRPAPRWLLDLHRFLGGLAVVFTAVHVAGLIADSYVHFGAVEILVPLASRWRPVPVGLGIVGLYLLLAVEATSVLKRRLPPGLWRRVHVGSFALFVLVTLHGVTAGSDARNLAFISMVNVGTALIVFLVLVRVWSPSRAGVPAAPTS